MRGYHINIFYSDDDESYIADIPDLRFCSASGDTPEKALEEVLIAQELWLEVADETGVEIPTPKYRPLIYQVS
ncbi:MAG: type II toxin-antitoxin system HicB family antitoxin [Oscillospiraceae bacterium]|jgi:predicted RNase H-like HicB family nuclease|nr:type II toxin-antitoxin system HicB family antitoxin [Oscillospiraceae bacterium]